MKSWKLKKGADERIRSRHPWVFASELLDSPKSIKLGEPIELLDYQGRFLARGYGNPVSQISFRALSFTKKVEDPTALSELQIKLVKSYQYRIQLGFTESFRWCYSEADQIPGLIIDRYTFSDKGELHQVFAMQFLTAGIDRIFSTSEIVCEFFKELLTNSQFHQLNSIGWENTSIILRNDVKVRELEGLKSMAPLVIRVSEALQPNDLKNIQIRVQNAFEQQKIVLFDVNLIEGQKTGFFLDQTLNMKRVLEVLNSRRHELVGKKIKFADFCCYMGQWSVHIVSQLLQWGAEVEVHLVDVSQMALDCAAKNVNRLAVPGTALQVHVHKLDVLDIEKAEVEFLDQNFDIIISDPPAFVKNRKDIQAGLYAYTKLNHFVFKHLASGGLAASCSCSGVVSLEDFKEAIKKAVIKSGQPMKLLTTGGASFDHPALLEFPEGHYLKMLLTQNG